MKMRKPALLLLPHPRRDRSLEPGRPVSTKLRDSMELAPPRTDPRVEGLRGVSVDPAADPPGTLHSSRMRTPLRIPRVKLLPRRSHGEHHNEAKWLEVLEQAPPRVSPPDRGELGTPPRATAAHPSGDRTATAGAAVPQPIIARLELAMPRRSGGHASPAVSAARHAARPCGVNPLRGFPSLRSVTPQRRPTKARLRRQATLTGSLGRRAQASTSSSAGADAKDRTSPSAASPATSHSGTNTTSGSGRHPTAD